MEELENKLAVELDLDALGEAAGGYKKPAEKVGFIIYKIVKGDNLTKIARRYNTTVEDLLTWNPKIKNKNLIYAGDYLYIMEEAEG